MFTVYAYNPTTEEKVLMHNDTIPDYSLKIIDPKVTLQESSSGSFSFGCAKDNPGYDFVERLSTIIIVYRDDVEIWRGRVIHEEEDFYFNRKFTCEGELGYLNDTLQPPHAYENTMTVKELLTALLEVHNSKTEEWRHIQPGYVSDKLVFKDDIEIVEETQEEDPTEQPKYIPYEGYYVRTMDYYWYIDTILAYRGDGTPITMRQWLKYDNSQMETREVGPKWVEGRTYFFGGYNLAYDDNVFILNPAYDDGSGEDDDDEDKVYYYTNRESTLSCINSLLIDKLGGHIVTRRDATENVCYLDYYADDEYLKESTQTVIFGKNLLDFTKNWDMNDFATVLVPLGAEITHGDDWPGDEDHPKGLTDYLTVESIGADYTKMTGKKYQEGTTYYRRLSRYRKADASTWVAGQTDVSDYWYLYTYEEPYRIRYYGPYYSDGSYWYAMIFSFDQGIGNIQWFRISNSEVEKQPNPDSSGGNSGTVVIGGDSGDSQYGPKQGSYPFDSYCPRRPWVSGQTVIGNPDENAGVDQQIWVINPKYPGTYQDYRKASGTYDSSITYYEIYYYYEAVNTSGWVAGQTDVSDYYTKSEQESTPYVIAQEPKNTYGWIEKVIQWEEITDPQELYNKAAKYLAEYQFDSMSLVVSAIDLTLIGVKDVEKFQLLDKVLVESPVHGLNKYFPITKIMIPLDNPENTEYTFGKVTDNSFTGSITSMHLIK